MRKCEVTFRDHEGEEHTITVKHPNWKCGKLTDEALSLIPRHGEPVEMTCGPVG